MKGIGIITLLLWNSIAFSQYEPEHKVYSRLGVYEWSFGYEHRLNSEFGVGIEVDYRPQFQESSYNNIQWGSWSLSQTGYRVKGVISFYGRNWPYVSILPFYRYLYADELIYDPGKFSGSNSSDYREYSQTTNELGLVMFMNIPMQKAPQWEVYAGMGGSLKNIRRDYSIYGTFSNQTPVDFSRDYQYILPSLYVGVKFNFLSWGEEK